LGRPEVKKRVNITADRRRAIVGAILPVEIVSRLVGAPATETNSGAYWRRNWNAN